MILTLTFNKQDFLSDTSAGLGEILILIIKDILSQRYNLYYLLNVHLYGDKYEAETNTVTDCSIYSQICKTSTR